MTKTLDNVQIENLKKEAEQLLQKYPRADSVRLYPYGFVPNAYHWPAPAERFRLYRDGHWEREYYDRKRPHGNGPYWVAVSAKGGTLASW